VSRDLATILLASAVGLTIVIGYHDLVRRRPRRILPSVLLLALSAAVYVFALPDRDLEAKGALQEGVAVALCYVSMVMGMIAQYFYKQAERGATKIRVEPLELLMPILASPIVFIPLLTITADMAFSGAFTKAKLMVYLVSFQNGFFWKSFFDQRQKTAEADPLLRSALTK
jgi:hypothetical protein